jgi:hypothetical protein
LAVNEKLGNLDRNVVTDAVTRRSELQIDF